MPTSISAKIPLALFILKVLCIAGSGAIFHQKKGEAMGKNVIIYGKAS
jgi:hypothetical protein